MTVEIMQLRACPLSIGQLPCLTFSIGLLHSFICRGSFVLPLLVLKGIDPFMFSRGEKARGGPSASKGGPWASQDKEGPMGLHCGGQTNWL